MHHADSSFVVIEHCNWRVDHDDLLPALCFEIAVDLADTIEILDIVLDEKQHNYGIPNWFCHAMVAIVCVSFLLSPWKMLENDFETGEQLPMRALLRYVFEMALVNFFFPITRLVILIKYKKDEFIFILKNFVAIILGIMGDIWYLLQMNLSKGIDYYKKIGLNCFHSLPCTSLFEKKTTYTLTLFTAIILLNWSF